MKRLLLALLLVGCSNDAELQNRHDNEEIATSCACLAKKYNLDMAVELHTKSEESACVVTHKSERSWKVRFSLPELVGLRKQVALDKIRLVPKFENCMKKQLPGYPNRKPDAEYVMAADRKCSLEIFKDKSIFSTSPCWGLE